MTDKATSMKNTFPVNNNEKTRFEERVSQNQLVKKQCFYFCKSLSLKTGTGFDLP